MIAHSPTQSLVCPNGGYNGVLTFIVGYIKKVAIWGRVEALGVGVGCDEESERDYAIEDF
jgi:hypothetical protein